jgi:hypothetical protein
LDVENVAQEKYKFLQKIALSRL